MSGQAGSGEIRSDQVRSSAMLRMMPAHEFQAWGKGLPAMKGWVLPGGQEPLGPDNLGFFTAPFWPFWQPSFFHRFFDSIID